MTTESLEATGRKDTQLEKRGTTQEARARALVMFGSARRIIGFPVDRQDQLSERVQRSRGGLVFEAHRLCASLNSRLESNNEEEEGTLSMISPRW